MTKVRMDVLVDLLSALGISPRDPERDLLINSGWVPMGKNSSNGLEGWGKIIDGRVVIVDQPEALEIQRRAA